MRAGIVGLVIVLAAIVVDAKHPLAKLKQRALSTADSTADVEAMFAASMVTENERGRWHVYSDIITEKAHEGIAARGLAALSSSHQALFVDKALKNGVVWNDMPEGVMTEEAAMVTDGYLDIVPWSELFFVSGGLNDLVFNVHYGCLQHVHSMAPIQRRQSKSAAGSRIVFTNGDVRDFIVSQLKYWWDQAKRTPTNPTRYSWYLGHMLHTIQDSYPRGHTVRDSTASTCGNIVLFQGYDAQHGNDAHKAGDFTPYKSKHESDPSLSKRYSCAVDYSRRVLDNFATCATAHGTGPTCDFDSVVKPWLLAEVYPFATGAQARVAGGAALEFGKPKIAADTANFRSETVTLGPGRTVQLFNPTSTQRWSGQHGVALCDGSGPLQSQAPEHTLGVKHYVNKPFDGFVNFAAPNTH